MCSKSQPVNFYENENEDEIKHGKTCHHWATAGKTCVRGSGCKFVHAWIRPDKAGICRKYLLGKCYYTENACYFQVGLCKQFISKVIILLVSQHIPFPIAMYEELAVSTKNYAELEVKVQSYLQEQRNRKFRPLKMGHVKQSVASDQKRFSKVISRPTEDRLSKDMLSSIPPTTKQIMKTSPFKTLSPLRATSQNTSSSVTEPDYKRSSGNLSYWSLQASPVHPPHRSSPVAGSTRTKSNSISSSANTFKIRCEKAEAESDGEHSSLATGLSERSCDSMMKNIVGISKIMKNKAMNTWTCDEVHEFVSSLGAAKQWPQYAELLKEEGVDGATLQFYKAPEALLEDFPVIKRGHARVLADAVNKTLQIYNE
eukprot:jgi/Bigna1/139275/aug1.49_g13983